MATKIIITPANRSVKKESYTPGSQLRTFRVVSLGDKPVLKDASSARNLVKIEKQHVITLPIVKTEADYRQSCLKRPLACVVQNSDSSMMYHSSIRKRQRLDHLTQDQKCLRRKLKNRVAAQTARDRKKDQMDDLITRVELLEKQNRELSQQNAMLRKQNSLLNTQNGILLKKLDEPSRVMSASPDVKSIKSAALISDPLQQGQDLRLVTMITLSLLSWAHFQVAVAAVGALLMTTSSSKSPTSSSVTSPSPSTAQRRATVSPALKWWGPKQRSWQPPKLP